MDRLSEVFERLSISAQVFYSGSLCGIADFNEPNQNQGFIHVLRSGELEILDEQNNLIKISEPSVIFYPRPAIHKLKTHKNENAELVCASVQIGEGSSNPLANALANSIVVPFSASNMLAKTTDWLFEEAFNDHEARQPLIDRLSEIIVIQLLRVVMEDKSSLKGVLNGLTHPRLAKVIEELHRKPEYNWNLDRMADIATMSRSKFAHIFRDVVGQTPADYLTDWRLSLSQCYLRKGNSVNWTANKVGYPSGSALARVFGKKLGVSPKEWQLLQRSSDSE